MPSCTNHSSVLQSEHFELGAFFSMASIIRFWSSGLFGVAGMAGVYQNQEGLPKYPLPAVSVLLVEGQ